MSVDPDAAFLDGFEREWLSGYNTTRWRADAAAWVTERLGRHAWSKQRDILASIRDHRLTAVQACHGPGKSAISAMAVGNWIDTAPLNRRRAVTTAPTGDQVRAVLWAEINSMAVTAIERGHPLPGRVNEVEWKANGQVVAFGRKPADHNRHGMQGFHAPEGVLVVIDEACGIPEQIWTAAMAIASDENSRILAIGNPDDPASYFARVCRANSGWNVIRISAFDTPNFTGEPVPPDLARALTSQVYVDDITREYGLDSPVYISKVLGLFPDDSEDGVIPLSALAGCRHERLAPRVAGELLPVELGVDPAEGNGGDEAVIAERRGLMVARSWRSRNWDTMALADKTLWAIKETGATTVKVDAIGVGKGVADRLRQMGQSGLHTARIVPVDVRKTARQPGRFRNIRSELWWDVGRKLSEAKGWDFSNTDWVPEADWDRLRTQLTAPKYSIDASGRVVVEEKQDTKDRLGRSPDNADALLLAFYTATSTGFFDALVNSQKGT